MRNLELELCLLIFKSEVISRCPSRDDIRKDPAFRAQFHVMCANIGVDPLASNKGVWAQVHPASLPHTFSYPALCKSGV